MTEGNSKLVLVAKDLRKTYNGVTRALNGVSIEIKGGTIFALLGPNGAGKTTFVKISATQLLPSEGTIRILGHDVVKDARSVRKRIAVVPQEARPLSLQTPYEHILTYLIARGVDVAEARRRTNSTIASLKLDPYRNVICANLSGGLRQRVLIAMAMSAEADLLLLDEPTLGLDPLARLEVWNLVRDYVSKNNRTILLTTHYMDEAESLSDELAIIDSGRVISIGTPREIKARLGATNVVVVKSADDSATFEPYGRVIRAGTSIRIFTDRQKADELVKLCMRKNIDVSVRQVSLEDVFIDEVGRGIDVDSETS